MSSSSSLPRMSASPSYPIPFGFTTTTTLTTTTSATIGAVIRLTIPTPSTPILTSYTTPPLATSSGAKEYPYGLPILVLTQLDVVVFDAHGGGVISTVTTVQRAPGATAMGIEGDGDMRLYERNDWGAWTRRERGGVIAACVLVVGVVVGMLVWCVTRKGVWERRGERKRRRMKGRTRWWRMQDPERSVRGNKQRARDRKRERLGTDDEERAGWEGNRQEEPRTSEERVRARAAPATVPAVPNGEVREIAGTHRGPAVAIYQTNGALRPDSFNQIQHQALIPESQRNKTGLPDTPRSSGGSGGSGRVSAYRALRAQQRRAERAMPYLQDPVQEDR